MSRTLFWYVFKDLARIFILASGALAGIMSFGGLLRPLTEQGLDAAQVLRVLGYFMPAMQTYSLPVAALFATTMVYGRLAADNELTACRAAGVGYWTIWLPAVVLGLIVAMLSLIFLCFVVPVFTLKVEQVIYSNLAKLVANQIEHNHRIVLEGTDSQQTIFAQQAFVMPPPANDPKAQVVQLVGPLFVRYERQMDKNLPIAERKPPAPEDFYLATLATAFIHPNDATGEVTMDAKLTDGVKFPRSFRETPKGGKPMQMSVHEGNFTSDPFPSPVRENVKFMPIGRLNEVLEHPEESRRIKGLLADFVNNEQQQQYMQDVQSALLTRGSQARLTAADGEKYIIDRGDCPTEIRGDKLVIGPPATGKTPARFRRSGGGFQPFDATAQQIRLRLWPDVTTHMLSAEADLIDTVMKNGEEGGDEPTRKSSFPLDFTVPMPADVQRIESRDARFYAKGSGGDQIEQSRLRKELLKLKNSAISEKHSRVSFALSCLILVMVGCALGMMFKSGNFLSAFALSVVPALISIVLVVTGQHVCENIPYDLPRNFTDPLNLGLYLIWSGNAAVLVIAVVLLRRLSKQ